MPRITPSILALLALACFFLPGRRPHLPQSPREEPPRVITIMAEPVSVSGWGGLPKCVDAYVSRKDRDGSTRSELLAEEIQVLKQDTQQYDSRLVWRVTVEGTAEQVRDLTEAHEAGAIFILLPPPFKAPPPRQPLTLRHVDFARCLAGTALPLYLREGRGSINFSARVDVFVPFRTPELTYRRLVTEDVPVVDLVCEPNTDWYEVTLAVTSQQAEDLAVAEKEGRLTMDIHSPAETEKERKARQAVQDEILRLYESTNNKSRPAQSRDKRGAFEMRPQGKPAARCQTSRVSLGDIMVNKRKRIRSDTTPAQFAS
jgi:hypothetical protein